MTFVISRTDSMIFLRKKSLFRVAGPSLKLQYCLCEIIFGSASIRSWNIETHLHIIGGAALVYVAFRFLQA